MVTTQHFCLHHFILFHLPRASIPRRDPAKVRRESLLSFRSAGRMWTWMTRTWEMVPCQLALLRQTSAESSFEANRCTSGSVPRLLLEGLDLALSIRSRRMDVTMREFVFRGIVELTTTCRLDPVSEKYEGGKEDPLGFDSKPTPSQLQRSPTSLPIATICMGRIQGFLFGRRTKRTTSAPSEGKGSDFPRSEGNEGRGEKVPACPSWNHTTAGRDPGIGHASTRKDAWPTLPNQPYHLQAPIQSRPFR